MNSCIMTQPNLHSSSGYYESGEMRDFVAILKINLPINKEFASLFHWRNNWHLLSFVNDFTSSECASKAEKPA